MTKFSSVVVKEHQIVHNGSECDQLAINLKKNFNCSNFVN